jgi:hypothetical protein
VRRRYRYSDGLGLLNEVGVADTLFNESIVGKMKLVIVFGNFEFVLLHSNYLFVRYFTSSFGTNITDKRCLSI